MCDKDGRGATICLFSLGNRCLLKWVRSRISEGRGGSGWRLSSALANKWAHAQTSVCVNFCDFFRYFPFSLSFFPFLVVSPSPPPKLAHPRADTGTVPSVWRLGWRGAGRPPFLCSGLSFGQSWTAVGGVTDQGRPRLASAPLASVPTPFPQPLLQ